MNIKPKCRTCSIELRKGYIPDNSHCITYQSKWYEGEPKKAGKAFFVQMRGIKEVKDADGINILAYRCPSCGLLEFYANDTKEEL